MDSKKFFTQALDLEMQLKSKQEQIRQLREIQFSIGSAFSDVKIQKSRNNDKLGDISAKILDLLREFTTDIAELLKIKHEIKTVINKIEQPEYRTVLEWRYINLCKWEYIAEQMKYNNRWLYRIHTRALKEADKVLESNCKTS